MKRQQGKSGLHPIIQEELDKQSWQEEPGHMDIMDASAPDTLVLSPNSTFHRLPSTVLFSREAKELVWISSLREVWVSTTVSHQTSTPTCAATPPPAAAAEHPPRRNLARAYSSLPPISSRVSESRTLVNFTSTATTAGGCPRLLTAAIEMTNCVK